MWDICCSGLEQPLNENKTLVDTDPKVSRAASTAAVAAVAAEEAVAAVAAAGCVHKQHEHRVKRSRLLVSLNGAAVSAQLGC